MARFYISRNYTKCGSCDYDCVRIDQEDEPCWGEVRPVDEELTDEGIIWIHACEGHVDALDGGAYRPYSSHGK